MCREGGSIEEFGDGLGGEVNGFNLTDDDGGRGGATEWNEDDLSFF